MENVYKVMGTIKKDINKNINEEVIAKTSTEALQIIQNKYGEGQYDAKLIKGKLYG